jgi:antitoxin component YwqK of YwqJK toxin-antitoxin module
MNHKEYYPSGELKGEGELLEIKNCTSREGGLNIEVDDHDYCEECILGSVWRKKGKWLYYNKSGLVALIGNYIILNYVGVPSVKNGIWSIFRSDGSLLQHIIYDEGKIIDLSIFDDDENCIE